MKKRVVSLMMVAAMAAGLMAGCGNSGSTSDSGSASSGTEAASGDTASSGLTDEKGAPLVEAGSWDGDVTEIVLTYLDMATPTDLQKVEDAVNAITEPDIGVHVTFKEYAIFTASSQYPLDITAGEQIDLMMVAFTNVVQFAEQGLIDPVQDLVAENAPYISWVLENEGYPLMDGTYYDGDAYGIAPVMYYYGTGQNVLIPNEYLEAAGVTIEEGKVYTLDELTDIYAAIKAAYPDAYPSGLIETSGTSTQGSYNSGIIADALGATFSSGALIGTDSTTIVNYYASDEYYDYLKHTKAWQEAGYIFPDATTTSSTASELISAGTVLSENMTSQPVMKSDLESGIGKECTQILLTEPYYTAQSGSGTFWTVPITAEEPEAAIRFLDYTYSNHDLHNLILWGIVGEHIEVLDADNYLIGFANGYDGSTSPYYNTFGLYGDRRYEYVWNLNNSKEANEEYTAEAMANSFQDIGYCYDATKQATAIANIDAVVAQYVPTLECGLEEDLDATYKEFLQALTDAGIDDVIADNQADFDAWLAEQ